MRDYDEIEPFSDNEIENRLRGETATSKLFGEALRNATPQQKMKAYALLESARNEWITTSQELSIVDYARRQFTAGNYSHPSIARYLADKSDQIF